MNDCLIQYYLCPEQYVRFAQKEARSLANGFFLFGQEAICYGGYSEKRTSPSPIEDLCNALHDVTIEDGTVYLSFDPSQIVNNLCCELYVNSRRKQSSSILANLYYFLRPALSVGARGHLQRFHLRGWNELSFPRWPVDCSVNSLYEQLMLLALKAAGA